MGEVLAYMLLTQEYGTLIGYKSVRDRELIDLPGRGIDVIGVENGEKIRLILGEVKVSNAEDSSNVVDYNDDAISKSLEKHIQQHGITSRKLWSIIPRTRDIHFREMLEVAALYWDHKMWTHLSVICSGILVRPEEKYKKEEFGKLIKEPKLVDPAKVRFLIICMQNDLEDLADQLHRLIGAEGGV